MSDSFSIEIRGGAELQAKLDQLKKEEADAIMRKALRAGAQVVRDEIAARAPEQVNSPGKDSTALPAGALKNDVIVTTPRKTTGPLVIVDFGKYTRRVALWVEYGHRLVRGGYLKVLANGKTRGRGEEVGAVQPHPFVRPAFEASSQRAVDAVTESIKQSLDKVWKNGERINDRS